MLRRVPASGMLAITLSALGCAGTAADERAAIHAWEMRARVERVAIGRSAAQARAILGRNPVHRPGHPDEPFPSPRRALSLVTPAGQSVRVELYVVAARSAPGCPDVHYEDVPVVFVDDVVDARDWESVEASWRGWGGSLELLRAARDGHECPYPRP